MIFADIASPQLIEGFGLPAGIVIAALVIVVLALVKYILTLVKRNDDLQEKRILESRETLTVLNALKQPLEKQTEVAEKTYDLVLAGSNKKGN
jgi:hypothetical protein